MPVLWVIPLPNRGDGQAFFGPMSSRWDPTNHLRHEWLPGNQAAAVSMCELALGLVNPTETVRVWLKEVPVGGINGLPLGGLIAVVAFLWKANPFLGSLAQRDHRWSRRLRWAREPVYADIRTLTSYFRLDTLF